MNRKRWIASMSVIAAVGAAAAPASSSAHRTHSTLLSGYGGPGAGEQAIIGSTLLGGPGGHSGSGGSGGSSGGRAGSGPSDESLAAPTAHGSSDNSGPAAPSSNGGSGAQAGRSGSGEAVSRRSTGSPAGRKTFVYPSALRSATSSHALGVSSGDLLLIAALVAGLGALGALTIRVARLQR